MVWDLATADDQDEDLLATFKVEKGRSILLNCHTHTHARTHALTPRAHTQTHLQNKHTRNKQTNTHTNNSLCLRAQERGSGWLVSRTLLFCVDMTVPFVFGKCFFFGGGGGGLFFRSPAYLFQEKIDVNNEFTKCGLMFDFWAKYASHLIYSFCLSKLSLAVLGANINPHTPPPPKRQKDLIYIAWMALSKLPWS